MNETPINPERELSLLRRFFRWLFSRRTQRHALVGLAALATLVAVFYLEEDWRGKRAWENCKRELEAKGAVLDWNKYIPPPVPDDQNFFTASTNILLRFKKAQTEIESALASQCSWLRIVYSTNAFPVFDNTKTEPLVVATITILPPAAGLERGTNIRALTLNDPAARKRMRDVIQATIGQSANGAAAFQFSELQCSRLQPAQIFVSSETPPAISDLESLVPSDTVTNIGRLRVAATIDKYTFQVLLAGVHITAAADYLEWSDQFVPAFDEIREALKRPCAVIPGDYSQPYLIPIPNFVTMRSVAQTLAQRAQCHLLLGAPAKALREVTLMHDLCRILQKPPTGKPETLVESMINVAITGLYVNTLADGLRLRAWQEPQLIALQEQFKGINLPSWVAESFRVEPVASIHLFETTPADKIADLISGSGRSVKTPNFWNRLKSPLYLYLAFAPQGWRYQNLVNMASLAPRPLDSFDLEHDLISPRVLDESARNVGKFFAQKSPFKTLVAIGLPNFAKATQTTAYNQTLVNQAQIVCALERYHLTHDEYPETLDALMPQFIEKLPHDIIGGKPLHYRRADDGKFLLYSVGWNEKDDGGEIAYATNGSADREKGDWVWQYPVQ